MYFYRLKFLKKMALKDILVISGHSGLHRYVSQGRNNVIIENLSDGKRSSVPATVKISMLEDIEIFTDEEDMSLREVLIKMRTRENGAVAISHKSPDAELKKYFAEVLPNYAKERVYVSDIRKIVMWYNQLIDLGITDFEKQEEEDVVEESDEKIEESQTGEDMQ